MGTAEIAGRHESFLRTEVVKAANDISSAFSDMRNLSNFYFKNQYNSGADEEFLETDLDPFYFTVADLTNFHSLLLELDNFANSQPVNGGVAFKYVSFAEILCDANYPISVPSNDPPELAAKRAHVQKCVQLAGLLTESSRDLEKILSMHFSNGFAASIAAATFDLFRFDSDDYLAWMNMVQQLTYLFGGSNPVTPGAYLDINAKVKDA